MPEVTLTEMRKSLFRLADAAVAGEPVVTRRKGFRLVLRVEPERVDDRDEDDPTPRTPEEFEQAARWERFWAKVDLEADREPDPRHDLENFQGHWEWSGEIDD